MALALACASACTEPETSIPATLSVISGDGQEAEAGTALSAPVLMRVTDRDGRVVSGVLVEFAAEGSADPGVPAGTVSPASVETNILGVARVRWTLGGRAGVQTLQARVGSSVIATVSATALPGPATSIRRQSEEIIAVTAGDSVRVVVLSTDRYGNLTGVSPGAVTWQISDPSVARVSRTEDGSAAGAAAVVVGLARGSTTLEARAGAAVVRFELRAHVGPGWPIAFAADSASARIYTMNADGTSVTRVTEQFGLDPAWSPDGAQIAFSSPRDFPPSPHVLVYAMAADGSGVRPLVTVPSLGGRGDPAWSPDGRQVAFVARTPAPSGNAQVANALFIVNTDGTGQRLVIQLPTACGGMPPERCIGIRRPTWSPDGTRLAFAWWKGLRSTGDLGFIGIVNADGTGYTEITRDAEFRVPGFAGDPAWSPDGRRIAFHGAQYPDLGKVISPTPNPSDIYVANADGSGLTRLTRSSETGFSDRSPAWSPDGRIAFTRGRGKVNDSAGYFGADGLYVMNADGSEVRRVASLPGGVSRPAWKPVP